MADSPSQNKTAPAHDKFPWASAVVRLGGLVLLPAVLAACAYPHLQQGPPSFTDPAVEDGHLRLSDGYRLPLRQWGPAQRPQRVVLALHGFNDYSHAFEPLGGFLGDQGVAVYAYDQRGFGGSPYRGLWPGSSRLVTDAIEAVRAVRERHPGVPLYLLGESMGGAVAMLAAARTQLDLEGLILLAPAVWGRDAMSPLTRAALWLSVRTVPGRRWTGQGLDIVPTDNTSALRRMGRDPLVIKRTRTDALWGITNLMDRASAAAGDIHERSLILYGLKDEIIPKPPTCSMLERLADREEVTVLLYPKGYHLLLQDHQASNVLEDIAAWVRAPGPLRPAAYRLADNRWRQKLCNG